MFSRVSFIPFSAEIELSISQGREGELTRFGAHFSRLPNLSLDSPTLHQNGRSLEVLK